jgi:tetratricopeptide (TPR) repeat protein
MNDFIQMLKSSTVVSSEGRISTSSQSIRQAAEHFCKCIETKYTLHIDLQSPGFILNINEEPGESGNRPSIDSLAAFILVQEKELQESPLVQTYLGALWTCWLTEQKGLRWVGSDVYEPNDERLPTCVTVTGGLSIAFPFSHAKERLKNPTMCSFSSIAKSIEMAPPPTGLAATMMDAENEKVFEQLLPPGAAELFAEAHSMSPAEIIASIKKICTAHPSYANWWKIASSLAFQNGDFLFALECARQLVKTYSHSTSRYHLGDILLSTGDEALIQESVAVFDEVLVEEPAFNRAYLKKAYALFDLGQDDAAIDTLRIISQGLDNDAEEARQAIADYLEDKGN